MVLALIDLDRLMAFLEEVIQACGLTIGFLEHASLTDKTVPVCVNIAIVQGKLLEICNFVLFGGPFSVTFAAKTSPVDRVEADEKDDENNDQYCNLKRSLHYLS